MAKRDPEKTARNKRAEAIRSEMDELLEQVLDDTGCDGLQSLNAKIGSKHEQLANIKSRTIPSHDEFISLYLDQLLKTVLAIPPWIRQGSAFYRLAKWYQDSEAFREYLEKFLERSFLKHYDEYSRVKPAGKGSFYWIGENNADWGVFITPRFRDGEWENDKSEIRKFKPRYFTIGHVLETGLVVPDVNSVQDFSSVGEYLKFFQNVLVRKAGSIHQNNVAQRYAAFVKDAEKPEDVPLLIPELRFRGKEKTHKHRLDFCVIDPYSLRKIGFELSPWSSHGQLKNTKKKLVKVVNAEAKANFEREIRKAEAYFLSYDIHVTAFTDSDLAKPDEVFKRIARYLRPERRGQQLMIHSKAQLMLSDLEAEIEESKLTEAEDDD